MALGTLAVARASHQEHKLAIATPKLNDKHNRCQHCLRTKCSASSTTRAALWHAKIFCAIFICVALQPYATSAHDQLERRRRAGQPPAIYSYAAGDDEPTAALGAHRLNKPYSWTTNRRLAKLVEPEATELQHSNEVESHRELSQQSSNNNVEPAQSQTGGRAEKFALLYRQQSGAQKRRPPVGHAGVKSAARGANRPRRPAAAVSGTKHSANSRGGVKGTKTKAMVPVIKTRLGPSLSPFEFGSNESRGNDSSSNSARPQERKQKRKNLVCYYGTWAVYRPDGGKFAVENIDPFLCTHVIYGFTGLSYDNLIKPLDPWNDLEDNYGKGAMKRFTNLKRVNPDLKTLVAIGGWNEGSIKYSKMASDPEARSRFVESVVSFLEKYNFDGLDFDWEYPGSRGGASYDKQNFIKLLRQLHEAFRPRGYLLTAAVSAGKWFIDPAYDIPQASKYLDLINLMAYDYHGGWESKTGHNAPLFSSARHDLSAEERMLNVNWSVNYWLQQGAAREKLMLGVGSYGRSFTLDKGQVNGINAPASQKGRAGPYTREPGSLGYNELCETFAGAGSNGWSVVRDPDYLAPYAFNQAERQWVGYDDRESLALKAQFAKSMGLGGMMMWSIETDDFRGSCHGEKFPLLNTIRRVLDDGQGVPVAPAGGGSGSTTTRRPDTSWPTSSSSTTKRPGHEIEDEHDGPSSTSTTTRRPHVASSTRRPPVQPTSGGRPVGPTRPSSAPSTTHRPPVPPPPPQPSNQEFACSQAGMFADPNNCRKFIRCVQMGAFMQLYRFDCAPGTAFNGQYCDHIHNVPHCHGALRSAPATSEAKVRGASQPHPRAQVLPADYVQTLPAVIPLVYGPRAPNYLGYHQQPLFIVQQQQPQPLKR